MVSMDQRQANIMESLRVILHLLFEQNVLTYVFSLAWHVMTYIT